MSRRKEREDERRRQIALTHTNTRINRMCGNKRAYRTLDEAENMAKVYSDPRYSKDWVEGMVLRTYYCSVCCKFHITKQEKICNE
jgi:hypothetical protein